MGIYEGLWGIKGKIDSIILEKKPLILYSFPINICGSSIANASYFFDDERKEAVLDILPESTQFSIHHHLIDYSNDVDQDYFCIDSEIIDVSALDGDLETYQSIADEELLANYGTVRPVYAYKFRGSDGLTLFEWIGTNSMMPSNHFYFDSLEECYRNYNKVLKVYKQIVETHNDSIDHLTRQLTIVKDNSPEQLI